jgi:hypothetical protein
VGGSASLCTSPGVTENLTLSGEIYNASMATGRTTEGSLLELRVLELTIVDLGGKRKGFFDLFGRWQDQELVLDDRGELGSTFLSGLKIENASVTLRWSDYSDFKTACVVY